MVCVIFVSERKTRTIKYARLCRLSNLNQDGDCWNCLASSWLRASCGPAIRLDGRLLGLGL